jgi:hypothetical protein
LHIFDDELADVSNEKGAFYISHSHLKPGRYRRGLDVVGGLDDRNGGEHVLSEAELRAGPAAGTDRLDGETISSERTTKTVLNLCAGATPHSPPNRRVKCSIISSTRTLRWMGSLSPGLIGYLNIVICPRQAIYLRSKFL